MGAGLNKRIILPNYIFCRLYKERTRIMKFSFVSECGDQISGLFERWLHHQWAFHLLWSECGAVSSETTESQKCLHKLVNNHTEVVTLCCD